MTVITSAANRRIKELARLRRRRHRDASGLFLIEGAVEIRRAAAADVTVETVLLSPSTASDEEIGLAGEQGEAGSEIMEVSPAAFAKVAYRAHPGGIVAVAQQFDTSPDAVAVDENALVLVAEAIEKPGNLGAMLRSADAAGASGLFVADPATDVFNPNVVRASRGALFSVPLACDATDRLPSRLSPPLQVVVAAADVERTYWDFDFTTGVAIVVGSEHRGVSAVWRKAGTTVSIPMSGVSDSLNASVAAALLLYEAGRQRR